MIICKKTNFRVVVKNTSYGISSTISKPELYHLQTGKLLEMSDFSLEKTLTLGKIEGRKVG